MAINRTRLVRELNGPETIALCVLMEHLVRNQDNKDAQPLQHKALEQACLPAPIDEAVFKLEELGLVRHPLAPNDKPMRHHWDLTTLGEFYFEDRMDSTIKSLDKAAKDSSVTQDIRRMRKRHHEMVTKLCKSIEDATKKAEATSAGA